MFQDLTKSININLNSLRIRISIGTLVFQSIFQSKLCGHILCFVLCFTMFFYVSIDISIDNFQSIFQSKLCGQFLKSLCFLKFHKIVKNTYCLIKPMFFLEHLWIPIVLQHPITSLVWLLVGLRTTNDCFQRKTCCLVPESYRPFQSTASGLKVAP